MGFDFGAMGLGGPNQLDIANKGFATGQLMGLQEQQMQQAQLAAQQKQQAMQEQARAQAELIERARGGDIEAQYEYALLNAKNSEDVIKAGQALDEPKRQARLSFATQLDSVARSSPKAFEDLANARIAALKNSEQTQETAQELATLESMKLMNPTDRQLITMAMVHVADPAKSKDYADIMAGKQRQPYDLMKASGEAKTELAKGEFARQQQQIDIQNKMSEINRRLAQTQDEGERRYLEQQKLDLEQQKFKLAEFAEVSKSSMRPQLSPVMQKTAEELANASVESSNLAVSSRKQIEDLKVIDPGVIARAWGSTLGDTFGGSYTEWRDKQEEIRKKIIYATKDVVGGTNLTNADMDILQKGIPSTTANKDRIIEYLSNLATVQDKVAAYKNMQSNWAYENGSLGPLKNPLTLENGGVIPAGTSMAKAAELFRTGRLAYGSNSATTDKSAAAKKLKDAGFNDQDIAKILNGKMPTPAPTPKPRPTIPD